MSNEPTQKQRLEALEADMEEIKLQIRDIKDDVVTFGSIVNKHQEQLSGSDPDTPRFANVFKTLGEVKEAIHEQTRRIDARWGGPKNKCGSCDRVVGEYVPKGALCAHCGKTV